MLPGTLDDRRLLAIDVLTYLNLCENIWQRRTTMSMAAELIHVISDPRIQEPFEIRRRTTIIATLKKDKDLWARMLPFVIPDDEDCICGHDKDDHVKKLGKCKNFKRWLNSSPKCGCPGYRLKPL